MVGFVVYRRVGGENSRGRKFDKEEQARCEYRRPCDDAAALKKLLKKVFSQSPDIPPLWWVLLYMGG